MKTATLTAVVMLAAGIALWTYGVVERVNGLPTLGTVLAFCGTAIGAKVIASRRGR